MEAGTKAGTGILSRLANSETWAWPLIPQFPIWLASRQQAPAPAAPQWAAIDAGLLSADGRVALLTVQYPVLEALDARH